MSKPPISVGAIVQWGRGNLHLGWVVGTIAPGEALRPSRDWFEDQAPNPMLREVAGYDHVNFVRGRSWTYVVRTTNPNPRLELVQAEKLLLVKKAPGQVDELHKLSGSLDIRLRHGKLTILNKGIEIQGVTRLGVEALPNQPVHFEIQGIVGDLEFDVPLPEEDTE